MINLEYIEQVIDQSNLVEECACLILEEEENYLIVLCKFRDNDQIDRLERFLRSHLMEHFLPNLIVPIRINLPLNLNGKIDRKSLISLYSNNTITNDLTKIWQVSSIDNLRVSMFSLQNLLGKNPNLSANFISNGGNSLLALTLIEQIKQVYSLVDTDDLFDLILHKTFGDLMRYVYNPERKQQTTEYFSSNMSIIPSNSNPIWSIERCSKIYLHHNNHPRITYSVFPNEFNHWPRKLTFHWKNSMKKCIDASPLIVLLDSKREYVIIGSHSGLINAYRIDHGDLVWSFQANDRIEGSGTLSRNGRWILLGDYSGILYIIDCSNGRLYSSYQCQGLIKTIPCIHSQYDMVYLGAHDQYLHAIEIQV